MEEGSSVSSEAKTGKPKLLSETQSTSDHGSRPRVPRNTVVQSMAAMTVLLQGALAVCTFSLGAEYSKPDESHLPLQVSS